jgi:uncharacterized membrane protein
MYWDTGALLLLTLAITLKTLVHLWMYLMEEVSVVLVAIGLILTLLMLSFLIFASSRYAVRIGFLWLKTSIVRITGLGRHRFAQGDAATHADLRH